MRLNTMTQSQNAFLIAALVAALWISETKTASAGTAAFVFRPLPSEICKLLPMNADGTGGGVYCYTPAIVNNPQGTIGGRPKFARTPINLNANQRARKF